jgi:hypothetical protein
VAAQSGQPFTPVNSSIDSPGGFPALPGFASSGFASPFGCGDVGGDGIAFNDRPNIGNPNAPANTVAVLNNIFCLNPTLVSNDPQNKIVGTCGDYIAPDGSCVNDLKTVRFVQVPIGGGFGNAGRNILTGPGTVNVDLSVSKSFRYGERLGLQLRADVYDLLNRQNPNPFAGNSYISTAQQVAAIAFYPQIAFRNTLCLNSSFGCQGSSTTTLARVSGATPENSIDAVDPATGKSLFLSHKFLTTGSRRLQLSLKFTF